MEYGGQGVTVAGVDFWDKRWSVVFGSCRTPVRKGKVTVR